MEGEMETQLTVDICPLLYLFIHLKCLSIILSIHTSTCLSIHPFLPLLVERLSRLTWISVRPSAHPSIHLSNSSISPSFHPFIDLHCHSFVFSRVESPSLLLIRYVLAENLTWMNKIFNLSLHPFIYLFIHRGIKLAIHSFDLYPSTHNICPSVCTQC